MHFYGELGKSNIELEVLEYKLNTDIIILAVLENNEAIETVIMLCKSVYTKQRQWVNFLIDFVKGLSRGHTYTRS